LLICLASPSLDAKVPVFTHVAAKVWTTIDVFTASTATLHTTFRQTHIANSRTVVICFAAVIRIDDARTVLSTGLSVRTLKVHIAVWSVCANTTQAYSPALAFATVCTRLGLVARKGGAAGSCAEAIIIAHTGNAAPRITNGRTVRRFTVGVV